MTKYIILSAVLTLSGCAYMPDAICPWCNPQPVADLSARENRPSSVVIDKAPQEISTAAPGERVDWLNVYVAVQQMDADEREARLAAIEASSGEVMSDKQAMHKALLMAVRESSQVSWHKAEKLVESLSDSPERDVAEASRWLADVLEDRFDNLNQQQVLRKDIVRLKRKVKDLEAKINALTNIEQNLTEKRENQDEL